MSLFKILRGDSSRISTDITPFHDGYAYFTSDDGGFYIDSEQNGVQTRHRINPNNQGFSKAVSGILLASKWENGKQTVHIDGVQQNSNGIIGLSQSVSDAEMSAAQSAELYVCDQGVNTVTIAVFGSVPTIDIPIVVILIM